MDTTEEKQTPKNLLRKEVLSAYQLAHGIHILKPGEDTTDATEIETSGLLSKVALKLVGGGVQEKVYVKAVTKDASVLRKLYYNNVEARRMVDKLLQMNRLDRRSVGLGA